MSVAKSSQELNMECGMSTVKRTLVAVFIVLVVVTVSVLLGWNPLSAFSGVERDRYDRARGGGDVAEEAAKEEEAPAEEVREEPREEREVVEARLERSAGSSAYPEEWTNSIGMKFRLIPAGEFWMGAVPGDDEAADDESPRHRVEITKPFYLGVYEVTQEQYERVMGNNPSYFKGSNLPVEYVSWNDAVTFCKKLSQMDGEIYRLPSEAEWEYAARGGVEGKKYVWGDNRTPLVNGLKHANVADESAKRKHSDWSTFDGYDDGYTETSPVGSFAANGYGLCDIAGNVWEWCSDWYNSGYYGTSASLRDPKGPDSGQYRVLRGGSWDLGPRNLRSSNRGSYAPGYRLGNFGFRILRDVD